MSMYSFYHLDRENIDRENIKKLLEIRQIYQYFPPSKFCAVRYSQHYPTRERRVRRLKPVDRESEILTQTEHRILKY